MIKRALSTLCIISISGIILGIIFSQQKSWEDNETLIDASETLIDANETLIDANENLIDASETLIDANETLIDANETLIDANETLIDANETLFAYEDPKLSNNFSQEKSSDEENHEVFYTYEGSELSNNFGGDGNLETFFVYDSFELSNNNFSLPLTQSIRDVVFCPSLSATFGRGIGYNHSYATAEALIVGISQYSQFTPFLDLRGHRFTDGRYAANCGIGARYYSNLFNMTFGGNVYYDYRETDHGRFNQIGVGLELITPCGALTLNGYIPVGSQTSHPKKCVFDHYTDGYFMIREQYKDARSGFDIELDSLLMKCGAVNVYGSVGCYYLAGRSHRGRGATGGEFGLSAYWYNYISTEIWVTTDRIYGTRAQGRVSVALPFEIFSGCGCDCDCDQCWWPVQRRDIIPTSKHCCWITNF